MFRRIVRFFDYVTDPEEAASGISVLSAIVVACLGVVAVIIF